MIMAVFGLLAFALDCMRKRGVAFSKVTIVSAIVAAIFSVWCYFCITTNNTDDTSYATYISSFATWLAGAYGACFLIRECHGRIDLGLLTLYLTLISVLQCVSALIIDNIPAVQRAVDSVVVQGQQFMHEVGRLYGIGAALDTAGVRFSVTLLLIAHQLSHSKEVRENRSQVVLYLVAYLFILVVGSMIARTTGVGAALGFVYMLASYLLLNRSSFSKGQKIFWRSLLALLAVGTVVIVVLYNRSQVFHNQFRFAFEGFFNWVEYGEFRTDSTDKLNNVMWIWPRDARSWMVGTGHFGNWFYSTDIGYCRIVLYGGIPAMVLFALMFVVLAIGMAQKFPQSGLLFLLMLAISFIIWVKVSTDLFFIYALLLCLPEPEKEECELSIA